MDEDAIKARARCTSYQHYDSQQDQPAHHTATLNFFSVVAVARKLLTSALKGRRQRGVLGGCCTMLVGTL